MASFILDIINIATLVLIAFFGFKAFWHWQRSADIITAADISQLSDGRDIQDYILESIVEQNKYNANAAGFAAFAALAVVLNATLNMFHSISATF